MPYRQLTQGQRYQIQALMEAEHTQSEIALQIGCHKSTISRELNRNSTTHYDARRAEEMTRQRRENATKASKFTAERWELIKRHLKKELSPAMIAYRARHERVDLGVSHETIYRWIREDRSQGGSTDQHLLRAFKPYKRKYATYGGKDRLAGRRPIESRPAGAINRSRLGHWEGDTMYGNKGHVVTLVDRKSRFFAARKVTRKSKRQVNQALTNMINVHQVKTLTLDNGSEFHGYKDVEERTGSTVYFAAPYASWQRGTNENANGILRRWISRATDLTKLSSQAIRRLVEKMNHRPMKCLGWKTPYEVHYKVSVALIT